MVDETEKAADAPAVTGGHTALGHAFYIFGTVTAIVGVIATVVVVHNLKRTPAAVPVPRPEPAAVIIHEPAPVKEQDRVVVHLPPVAVEPEVPAVAEPEPTPEAAPAPAVVPEIDIAIEPSIDTPSASEPVPHTVRKRAHRPAHREMEAREIGFWASFMRRAAEFSRGPSK